MIKKLLILSVMGLTALSATAEIVDGVRQRPIATCIAEDYQVDNVYYLYNTVARQFFCGANDWNTRASISPNGYKVKLVDTMGDGTVEIVDSVETQSTWKSTFSTADGGAIWVDNSTETYRYWTFTKASDGSYRITNEVMPEKFLGWNGNEGDTRLYFVEADAAGVGISWQFVNEESYNAYQEAWAIMKDQFEKAAELKIYLDQAKEAGVNVNSWEAVYLNESATVEELESATAAVQKAINDNAAGDASVSNPSDMTASILNPTFENASYDGWKGTAPNMTGSGAHGPANVAEHYNKTFDTYQDLSGMPKGVYALSATALFRGSWNDHANHTNYVAYLYAKADGDTLKTEIPNPWDAMNTEPMAGETSWGVTATEANETHDGVTYYVPNDPSAGRLYFEKGFYQKQVFFALDSEDPVRIGVMKQAKVTDTDWVMFDNFKLTYYGGDAEAYQFWLDEMKKEATDYSEAIASVQYKEAYLNAYDVQVATKAEAIAAMKNIEKAAAEIAQNSNLWNQLIAARESANTYIMGDYDGLDTAFDLSDYLDIIDEEIIELDADERNASNEELQAAIDKVKVMIEAVKEEAKTAMKPGDDATNYMTNADFSNGKEGWTIVNNGGGNVQSTAGTFEAWHSTNFDVYQDVKNLPLGVYEISVQGYVRYLDGTAAINAKGNVPENIPIYVYMNDSKSRFANWFDYPQESGFYGAVSGASFLTDNEGFEYPDNTTAASAAFDKGDYTRSAFGLVAKKGDILRVGVKGNPATAEYWPCFDNFKLTYRGYAAEVVKPILENSLTEAAALTAMTTKSAKAAMATAIATANETLTGTEGKPMFDALSALTKAISDYENGNASCQQLIAAATELAEVANSSASTKADEAKTLTSDAISKAEASELEAEEIADYLQQVDKMKLELQLPEGYLEATDDNPADVTAFIKTPSFEKVTEGIETNSIEGWQAVGYNFGNDDTQKSALALEFYNKTFDMYQEIEGLPNGTYKVSVNAFERSDNPAYLYATSGEQTASKELTALDADVPEGSTTPNDMVSAKDAFLEGRYLSELIIKVTDGKLRIGIKKSENASTDWVIMDDFKLTYYGANSSKQQDGDATPVEFVAKSAQPVAVDFYTLDGRRATAAQKGLFILKTTMSDGTVVVKKIRK